MKIDTYTSGTNNQMVGPGTTPAEAPAFAAGGQLGPGTPYDMFQGAPLATGQGLAQDFLITPGWDLSPAVTVNMTFGYASASGTGNVINYWGDSIMASINPNVGRRAFTLVPAFTTHNGQNTVSGTEVSVLSGQVLDKGGNYGLTIGWLNLHQNVPWLFNQAPWTTTPFSLAPQIAGSIGDGPPTIDVLKNGSLVLPMSGGDFWIKDGISTVELTSADLPSPYLSPARALSGSFIQDHGDGLRYALALTGLTQWGPDTGNVLWGGSTTLVNNVPQSTVTNQRMMIVGLGATMPLGTSDGELRYGYSCYSASNTLVPTANCAQGNYYYGKLHHGFSHFDMTLEGVRFEPRYAPAILDYGVQQNVWSYPAAWPANWLRGTYQLVDNSLVGPNRQGGRIQATTIVAGVEMRFAFGEYSQIQTLNANTALTPGFVEPYFLPQTSLVGTTGTEQHFEGWFNWHAKWGDVTLDLAQVNTWRQAPAGQPQDNVVMQYPSGVLTLSHDFGPKVFGAAGVARFALNGQFDTSGPNNASLSQDVVFAGLELRSNGTTGYGLQYRLYSVSGTPTIPGGLSPAFHGPQIQFYQRFKT